MTVYIYIYIYILVVIIRSKWGISEVVGTVEQGHCSRRRLFQRGLEFHVYTINISAHAKKVWKLI